MKTFSHAQLPAGFITNAETLKCFLENGTIKLWLIKDDGAFIDSSYINEYLSNDNAVFINSLSTNGEGMFIWLMDNNNDAIVMADRRLFLHFYTDDDGE